MIRPNELVTVKISDLKDDPSNPNAMSKEQHNALSKSYQKFGNLRFIVADQNNVILDGHQRKAELTALGETEAQVIRVQVGKDTDRIMIRQILNKLYGQHDKLKDANDFLKVFQAQQLVELAELLARPQEEFQRALEKHHGIEFVKEDDFDVDSAVKEPSIAKTGEIWQLGRHLLMVGDATKKEDVDRLMDNKLADLLCSDPPYGVDYASKNRFLNSIWLANRIEEPIVNDAIENYREWFGSWLKNISLAVYNSYYLTISGQKLLELSQALLDNDFRISQYLVWVKNNHVLGRQDYANKHELIVYGWKGKHEFYGDFQTTVWEVNKPQKSPLHPTMKPIELLSKMITNSSKPDGLVVDLFGGSGSTLIACEQLGRTCYMMEVTPEYASVIIKRWEQLTNQKAVLNTSSDTNSANVSV